MNISQSVGGWVGVCVFVCGERDDFLLLPRTLFPSVATRGEGGVAADRRVPGEDIGVHLPVLDP